MVNFKILLLAALIACSMICKSTQNAIGEARCNKPADIVFVLDASSSIWGPDFKKQLAFVNSVINDLDQNVVRCGLLTYGDNVRVEFDLRKYAGQRQALTDAVSAVRQLRGDTRTDKALHRMKQMMLDDPREGIPRIAVVMTDGKSNHPELTNREAKLAHQNGITTFAVGIGKDIDVNELKSISSHEEFLFTVDNYDALVAIKNLLREKACEVKFVPPPVKLDLQNTEGCEQSPTDIVFMLDSSSNVRSQDFSTQLKFVDDMISFLPLSPTKVRVGVATYSNIPKQQLSLDQHTSPDDISKAIHRIVQQRGSPNTTLALRHLRQYSFGGSQDHKDLRKMAILITSSPYDGNRATIQQAQLLHEDNVRVFVVGIGPAVDLSELESIASDPSQQHLMTIDNYDNLNSLKALLTRKICVSNEPYAALHRGDDIVRERDPKTASTTQEVTTLTTTTTTTTRPPPRGCGTERPADIVFSIPSTANSYQTRQALEFIRSFAERTTVSPTAVRIGLTPRSCLSVPGFKLDQGTTKTQVLRMFESNKPKSMLSDTASVIKYLRSVSFSPERGARTNAKKIGVIFVDGPVENFNEAVDESLLAKEENIELIVIGAGSQVSTEQLTMLASKNSQQTVMTVESYSHLKRNTKRLVYTANQRCISQ